MAYFFDYLRMTLGWWSGEAASLGKPATVIVCRDPGSVMTLHDAGNVWVLHDPDTKVVVR